MATTAAFWLGLARQMTTDAQWAPTSARMGSLSCSAEDNMKPVKNELPARMSFRVRLLYAGPRAAGDHGGTMRAGFLGLAVAL